MSSADLLTQLRSGGDPLQMLAADALAASSAETERLHERIAQLAAVARLNCETSRNMQRAAAEADREQYPFRRSGDRSNSITAVSRQSCPVTRRSVM